MTKEPKPRKGWAVVTVNGGHHSLGGLLWKTRREAERFYAPLDIVVRRATLTVDPVKTKKRAVRKPKRPRRMSKERLASLNNQVMQ